MVLVKFPLICLLAVICIIDICADGHRGRTVVDKALEKLSKYDDKGQKFLKNIAKVESKYGMDEGTYRKDYHGGIWQVDEAGFKDTQDTASHPKLKERYKKIKELYDIDWENVKWEDLRDPFMSALAARLLLQNKPDPLPDEDDIDAQAEYWKKHYNTEAGAGTVEKFKERATAVEDSSYGDPHIVKEINAVGDKVCYNLIGKPGDFVRFFQAEGLTVNVRFREEEDDVSRWLDQVAVITGDTKVIITKRDITVNGVVHKWSEKPLQSPGLDIKISHNYIMFAYERGIGVKVLKYRKGFNFEFDHDMSLKSDGIFGLLGAKIERVDKSGKHQAQITLADGAQIDSTLEKRGRRGPCWQLPRDFLTTVELSTFMIECLLCMD